MEASTGECHGSRTFVVDQIGFAAEALRPLD
jgi:hypothetical protein